MKRVLAVLLCLLSLLVLMGCENKQDTTTPPNAPTEQTTPTEQPTVEVPAFTFTEENFPRIDGSTATIPIGEAVTALMLGKTRDESTPNFSGTSRAWIALANSDTDLLVVYEAAEETKTWMDDIGTEMEIAPIGRDALVFLVNQANTVDGITTKQLQDIYTGAITNWSDVGGENKEIIAYQRPSTSGSQTLMVKLVMPGLTIMEPPVEYVIAGMEGLVDSVAEYRNTGDAIGYNVFYYVTQMHNSEAIKLLAIDGVAPTNESIGSGQYPFTNDFYVAIRKNEPVDSATRVLYNWLTSDQGRALIEHEGYVTITE